MILRVKHFNLIQEEREIIKGYTWDEQKNR